MTRLRTRLRNRVRRDERGASLILVITFMIVAGMIGAGLTLSVTSSVADSNSLTNLRNREYAADAGIEMSIAQTRANPTTGTCSAPSTVWFASPQLNGFTIRVDCANTPSVIPSSVGTPVVQHDVTFSACDNATGLACTNTNANVIIRAQVNFQTTPSKTYVLSWSVNG